jgi:pyruvate/2-oxoglutarate dehydrogenase complex dihydrolipoamide acyltransferase (E2) component
VDGRRLGFLAALAGVGLVLLVLGRPGGDAGRPADRPAAPPADPTPAQAAPAQLTPPATPPAAAPASAPSTPPPVVVDGGVAGAESLDPAELPAALRAAERFAADWAEPGADWHDLVSTLATPELAAALAGADPPRPAPELTGAGQVFYDAPQWARIGVPATGGTVVLDVVAVGDRWLVSAVDWWPA